MPASLSSAPIPRATSGFSRGGVLPRLCAAVMLVFGFLPIANWIRGGHQADWYPATSSEWLSGSLISIGMAVVAFILTRRLGFWPASPFQRLTSAAHRHPLRTTVVVCSVSFVLYAIVARVVFSARPLLIDEIVQLMQARIFASGRLSLPAPAFPEFFSALHVVDHDGRSFSQFPPGGPFMLVPGVLLGVPWLMGPVFGAFSAGMFWSIVRVVERRPNVAVGAACLFALAPFTVFMAGSHMNHVPTLFWLLVGMWSLFHVSRSDRPVPWMALLCGLSFGTAATIRPTDAMAFALPAAVWLLWRARGVRAGWRDVLASGAGVALPLVLLLAYNAYTTGDPLLFGYELLWGKSHALGFHRAPWGAAHTPARGLELVNLYFMRLQTYLFETPLPSLVPALVALLLTPAVRGFDRYLLWSSALLVVAYFAYWHDGFFLGPRFFYPLLPALVLWTARLPGLVRERFPGVQSGDRFVILTYLASLIVGLALSVPVRARQYAGGLTSMRHDYLAPARASGVEHALILVRESWGAQLIARLWALGVPRSETETLYRGTDTCILESAVSRLEQSGVRDSAAVRILAPLLADSGRVVKSEVSPDKTERVLPGQRYEPVCAQRIQEDRTGYTFLAPILAAARGTNIYARDLHGRDTLLIAMLRGRPIYVLRPASSAIGAPLGLFPLSLDSARAEWRGAQLGSQP